MWHLRGVLLCVAVAPSCIICMRCYIHAYLQLKHFIFYSLPFLGESTKVKVEKVEAVAAQGNYSSQPPE